MLARSVLIADSGARPMSDPSKTAAAWETYGEPMPTFYGISHERALSWFAPVEPTRVVVGNGGSHQRLVYVFEDLD